MALTLKQYQADALQALQSFLIDCLSRGAKMAFESATGLPYKNKLDTVPSVCLRVPTGGGKTLIAAHSIGVSGVNVLVLNPGSATLKFGLYQMPDLGKASTTKSATKFCSCASPVS